MYSTYFGFTRDPFEVSPDPYFLVRTPLHNEALASIYYGVRRHKGFVVLTGEVGTGKTLVVRCLLDLLSADNVAAAYVFNPSLSASNFLEFVLAEFSIPYANKSKAELLRALYAFLIARHQQGKTTTLVIDEAQHLPYEVLEEIRLLTNLETSQYKLLQIVLVGQVELEQKLDSPWLRQLKQRVALRCSLQALSEEAAAVYIEHRVTRAGAGARFSTIFPQDTVAAICRYSRGLPRLINIICDNALLNAYAQRSGIVTPAMVDLVAADLRLMVSSEYRNPDEDEVAAAANTILRLVESFRDARRPRAYAPAS